MFSHLRNLLKVLRSSNKSGERKESSNLSTSPALTRSESQLAKGVKGIRNPLLDLDKLSNSQLSQPDKPEHLYWCSFRSPLDEFVGVVICRGKTPGGAANNAIKGEIVESERASIVMIPPEKEASFEGYCNRLLDADTAKELLKKLDIQMVVS